jgi:uncharacterized protein (TIGR02391 family)
MLLSTDPRPAHDACGDQALQRRSRRREHLVWRRRVHVTADRQNDAMAWQRDRPDTVELPIDALALLVLRDYDQVDGWNWQNWMRESEQFGTARDPEINSALSEAWSWLMTHGLVVRNSSQSSTDAYRISRLGREALQYGVARLAAGERLGVALHPRLAERIQQQFLLGEFELAVFAAMKEVEVRVRELANQSSSLLGTKLMQKAFAPESGVLTDPEIDSGERVATMELFKGAIGVFKNPSSHRPVDYDDPTLASEVVLFADLLLRMLDRVEERVAS